MTSEKLSLTWGNFLENRVGGFTFTQMVFNNIQKEIDEEQKKLDRKKEFYNSLLNTLKEKDSILYEDYMAMMAWYNHSLKSPQEIIEKVLDKTADL